MNTYNTVLNGNSMIGLKVFLLATSTFLAAQLAYLIRLGRRQMSGEQQPLGQSWPYDWTIECPEYSTTQP